MSRFIALYALVRAWLAPPAGDDPERGSHTTDVILWILGVIVVVGIVVAAVTAFLNARVGELQ